MRKTFVTNLVLLLFLNLLIKPLYIFGIDRSVQNAVGSEIYGLYAAMFSLSVIFNIILDMGIANYNNRMIAQDNTMLPRYFSNMTILKCLLGLVYAAVLCIVGICLDFSREQFSLFAVLILNQFIASLTLYFRSNISGMYMYRTDSCISVTDRLLMIIICGYLLINHGNEFKIEWFVYAQTIAYAIPCIIAFYIVLSRAGKLSFHVDFHILFNIIKQTYPFALLSLLMGLYTRIDMVMIERMLPDGAEQAGLYAQAYRILDAVSMFAYLFATLLLPMFSKMIKNKEPLGEFTKFSFLLLMIPVFIFVTASIFYSYDIMKLMYHDGYESSSSIYKVLILGFIPIASTYIFGTLLTANNSLKALNIMALIGMIFNIVCNAIFIPRYGALGAALVSVLTQFLTGAVQVVLAIRCFSFSIPYATLARLFIFLIMETALYYIPRSMLTEIWYLNALIIMGISLLFAFAIRLIRIKDIAYILKNED